MKEKIILGSLIVLFIVLAIPNVSAAYDTCTSCHPSYAAAIQAKQHANSDVCTICHKGGYSTTHIDFDKYIGYNVNETTCNQAECHSNTSGSAQRPVFENHSSSADCTQCHFANTTKLFPLNTSLYVHDHNFTVEYNFYNYNLSGMPLKSNNGTGKGMFPYYTCTLTCHDRSGVQKIDEAANSWNQSKHARSIEEPGTDNNMSCAKCKSPTNYNFSTPDPGNTTIAVSDWQGIQCRVCHSIHDRKLSRPIGGDPLAYYNATASSLAGSPVYEAVHNATELCENCHTTAPYDSKFAGTHKDVVGFDCASCHLNTTFNKNETHTFEVKNTTSGVEGCAVCHAAADHTWQYTSRHTGKVTCEACHDQTVARNATGYALTSDGKYGLYNDTGLVSSYKDSDGSPVTWPLHNISKAVSCDKCHGTKSNVTDQLIAPGGGTVGACASCHSSYNTAYNNSEHNATLNGGAPGCTGCHTAYDTNFDTGSNKHMTRAIVNRTTCINCHVEGVNGFNFTHKNATAPDCTQCHYANTTTPFALNASYYTTDHNLTVEHNYYYYNQSGTVRMPLNSNGGVGEGMFPYWTCTQWCHPSNKSSSTKTSIDNASITWVRSAHAQSLVEAPIDQKNSCAKCKSPPNYNVSASSSTLIPVEDWQGIQCRVCHDIHYPKYSDSIGGKPLAFYNATATSNKTTNPSGASIYDPVHNATELCEKCHTGSSHDSKFAGFHKDTLGFDCASCHLNTTSVTSGGFNNVSHSFEVRNAYTDVTGCEVCHSSATHNSTFQWTSMHTGKVTCEACHDQTVSKNATGYAITSDRKYGLYNDTATGLISSWKGSTTSPSTWPLHNISVDVSCDKCHGTKSAVTNLEIAPAFGTGTGCAQCHTSYVNAVNSSMHNKTRNPAAPSYCTDCHTGYDTQHSGFIVNESNTCVNCHNSSVNGFGENHTGSSPVDCTVCHFANTTRTFTGFNSSLYTHDHNLTVEYNFYNYNLSGMPLSTNNGAGKGMFPYYTCTLTCHNGTGSGQPKIENETSSWNQSAHARSLHMSGDNKQSCAKCKSPANYNVSLSSSATIAQADWQGIQCRVCHDLHNVSYSNSTGGKPLAFYNATATSNKTTNPSGVPIYNQVHNATELCENCHTGSSHDSKYGGTHKDVVGFDCADCHANSTFNNATHLFEVKNTTSGAIGCEVCHDKTPVHSNFFEYSIHEGIVTCEACHDNTVARNSSDFVVNVSAGMDAGIYKDTSTNEWTTYKVSHGSPATWPLHNISKGTWPTNCNKCHGARSVYSGAIAPNLTSGGISYYTTDTLVEGYNLVLLLLNPNPTLNASDLLYTSPVGIPGVTKALKWDSAGQTWVSYQYIVPSGGIGFYYGTNFTMDGYKAYFIKGNATTAGRTYTFVGTK